MSEDKRAEQERNELERTERIRRNKMMMMQLGVTTAVSAVADEHARRTSKPKPAKRRPAKPPVPRDVGPRRRSRRIRSGPDTYAEEPSYSAADRIKADLSKSCVFEPSMADAHRRLCSHYGLLRRFFAPFSTVARLALLLPPRPSRVRAAAPRAGAAPPSDTPEVHANAMAGDAEER